MKSKQILNIFETSKKKRSTPTGTGGGGKINRLQDLAKVTIDTREKNSLILSELVSLGLETEFKQLKVADYLVRDVAIERKTVSDFISSIINKRLLKQLEELQQYENRLLIIEGIDEQDLYSEEFAKDKIGMHPNAVRGFLLSVVLKSRTPIIYSKNQEDTAKFIYLIARKPSEYELPLNPKKRNLTKKQQLQFILEGFPGVGPTSAKKLLKKFKTIKNIINASEEELKEVLGKKSEGILDLIDKKY